MWRWLLALTLASGISGCGARAPVPQPPSSAPQPSMPLDTSTGKRAAFAQAYTLFRHGEHEQALPLFTALAERYPALADYALFFAGTIAVRRGDDAAAEGAFGRLLREYPESVKAPAASLTLGQLLLRTGRVDQARPHLQIALIATDASTAQGARLALADLDERLGDLDAAYAGYMAVRRQMVGLPLGRSAKQRVQALRDQRSDLIPAGADLLSEAKLLLAEHDYAAAQTAADVLVHRPDGVEPFAAWRVQADALYGRGEVEAALSQLRALVDQYPASDEAPGALFRLASVRWNRDQDEAALNAFAEFRRRYPDDHRATEALYASGRIHQSAGRNDLAVDSYVALLTRQPRGKLADEARWRIGWMRYLSGDWAAAAASFARLARETAASQVRNGALYWKARALAHHGQVAAARALYTQIVEGDRTDYYAMWAERRLAASPQPLLAPGEQAPALAALAGTAEHAGAVGPAPQVAAFHFSRWGELRAAGIFALARDELKAVERERRDDLATMRYLLRAYQAVEGFAAAQRVLGRLGEAAGLSHSERQRLLYPLAFWTIVARDAGSNAVDPLLIEAVMRQESRFDPQAQSPAEAYGLMQLLPRTATRVAANGRAVEPSALFEPDVNIALGARYLNGLLVRFGGDVLKALAAYNGGEAAVEKWERRFAGLDPDEFVESISYRETRDYVKRVMTNYRAYRQLYVEQVS